MPARADEHLRTLMSGILQKDPDERFTLDQIFDHPWCDTSSLDINLTEVLSQLDDLENKKSLMKQYMEEADSEDDVDSDATTAEEEDDGLDREREQQFGNGRRAGECEEIAKRNKVLSQKKVSVLSVDSGAKSGCVIC